MVALFAGLKLTLLKNRFRSSAAAGQFVATMLVVGAVVVPMTAGLVLLRLFRAGQEGEILTDFLTIGFVFLAIGWAFSPLLAFGIDETLDPHRFALLPIPTGTLLRGLLVAALIGVLPIGNALALAGAAVSLADPWWTLILSAPGALLQLLLCVLLSRAMAATMSGLLRSRRGRDLAVLAGLVVVLAPQFLNVLIGSTRQVADPQTAVRQIAEPLRWLPPGALSRLAADAGNGAWALVAYDALVGVGAVALVAWWWRAALSRSLVRPDSSTSQALSRRRGLPGLVETLLPGRVGLVAGRDLRLAWRDPMRRMSWVLSIVCGFAVPFIPLATGAPQVTGGAYGSWFLAVMIGIQAGNQFGYDGSGLWQQIVATGGRADATAEVWGHTVAVLVPAVVLVPACAALCAIASGAPAIIPAGIGLSAAVLGGLLAGSCVASAWMPYGLAQSRTSAFASSAPGQGGKALGALLISVLVAVPTVLPSLGCLVATTMLAPSATWILIIVGPVSAAIALVLAVRATGAYYADQAPRIFATVAYGDRA